MSAATPRVLDMSEADRAPEGDTRATFNGKLLTSKQIRARARRAERRRRPGTVNLEASILHKPIEDWDMEELARGRPRAADGTFKGRRAAYISREVHEAAMDRFKAVIREGMNANAINALKAVEKVLGNDDVDKRGRPLIPASVKLQAAQYLLDHIVGRAVQPTQSEISVKLQGILGAVMVSPAEVEGAFQVGQYATRALPGEVSIDALVFDDDDEDEDDERE